MFRQRWFRPLICAAAAGTSLAGCQPQNDGPRDLEQLMQTSRDWAKTAATGDIDKTLSYWADDAVVMMPGQPTARGKSEIRKFVEASSRVPGFRIAWEPIEGRISDSGDMGYLIERTQVSVSDGKGGTRTDQLRGVTVWRKQADGSWKNVVDVTTPAP